MKRLRFIVAFIVTLLLSITPFCAENVFNINVECDDIQKNGLFEVSVVGNSDSDICAGEMVLSFDESVAEFVEIKSDSFEVEAKENDDSVHIIFARTFPSDSHSELFKIVFRSLSDGYFDLNISCNESVDVNLEKLSGDGTTAQIEVNNNDVSFIDKESSAKTNKSAKSFGSKAVSDVEYTPTATSDDIDITNKTDVCIIVLFVVGFCVLIAIVFYLGIVFSKKTSFKDTDEDNEHNDSEYFY